MVGTHHKEILRSKSGKKALNVHVQASLSINGQLLNKALSVLHQAEQQHH